MHDNGDSFEGEALDASRSPMPSRAPHLGNSMTPSMALLDTRFKPSSPGTGAQIQMAINDFSSAVRQALTTGATIEQLVEVLLSGSYRQLPESGIIDVDENDAALDKAMSSRPSSSQGVIFFQPPTVFFHPPIFF